MQCEYQREGFRCTTHVRYRVRHTLYACVGRMGPQFVEYDTVVPGPESTKRSGWAQTEWRKAFPIMGLTESEKTEKCMRAMFWPLPLPGEPYIR